MVAWEIKNEKNLSVLILNLRPIGGLATNFRGFWENYFGMSKTFSKFACSFSFETYSCFNFLFLITECFINGYLSKISK